jgi:hypothetical protein
MGMGEKGAADALIVSITSYPMMAEVANGVVSE